MSHKANIPLCSPEIKAPLVFSEVYELYSKKMYRFAVSYTGDADIAMDLVQDVFTSIWERRETLSIKGPIENYLIRAIKLKIFQAIRDQEVRQRHQEGYLGEGTNTTIDDVLFEELWQNHHKIVYELSPKKQEIYKLSFEEGLNNKEISGRLSVSEKTVEYHIGHIVRLLKRHLLMLSF